MVIREGPNFEEDKMGSPMLGDAGRLWKQLLKQAGIDYRDIFMTNLTRCHGGVIDAKKGPKDPSTEEIVACSPFLDEEIKRIQPVVIVPVGNIALRYFLESKAASIMSHRGTEFWSDKYNCKIIPTIHPAAILRNPQYTSITVQDLVRIKESSKYTGLTPKSTGNYTIVDTPEKVEMLFKNLTEASEIAIDIETTDLNPRKGDISCIGFSWKDREGWCLPLMKAGGSTDSFWEYSVTIDLWERVRKILEGPSKKIGHNFKFDQKFFIMKGIKLNNFWFDTMLAHHLIDENAENLHGLKDCAWAYTDMGGYDKDLDDWFKANKQFKGQYIQVPFDMLNLYCAKDADCTFRLFKIFEPQINAANLTRLMRQVVLPARDVLMDAELLGIQADRDYIEKLRVEYSTKRSSLEQSIFGSVGQPFNINSSKQLQDILFTKLGFSPAGKTKGGGLSTDNKAIEIISKQNPNHPIPKLLLEYKDCQKILSTFIEGLSEHIDVDGRVHSNYKQHGTTTGRLSSSEPNMQQIPRESIVRGIFISRPGYKLIEADYSSAEFRWWGEYSRDPQMVEDLKNNVDIHRMTYALSHGVDISSVTDTQRQQAKATVFGLMFGRGTWSLAEELGIPESDAKKIVSIFFGRYPQAQAWLKQQIFIAKKTGQVVNYFGRIRRLPGINSNQDMARSEAERQCKNSPIQGAAADMTMIASVRIKKALLNAKLTGSLVMTVHDSLVYEVPENEVEATFSIVKAEAERPVAGAIVPMLVDIKVGTRLGSLKKIKNISELSSELCIK
jgi:DNA polymerase-1